MKKSVIFAALFICISLTVSAQGLYLDVGAGFGQAWTRLNGQNALEVLNAEGLHAGQMGISMSFKAGHGPVADMPLYIVAELAMISHALELEYMSGYRDQQGYGTYSLSLDSAIIGPGIIYYPISLIQLGASAGFSFVANTNKLPNSHFQELTYRSKGGFAWNVSAALDFGSKNHGCLVGAQFFNAINGLQMTNITQNAFLLGIFVKYSYRHKPQLFFF
jgi:hypothetical protein